MNDYSFALTLVFAATLVLGLLVKFYLASRQIRHVMQHRDQVPAAFASTIKLESHQKAADYTVTKTRFGLLEMAFSSTEPGDQQLGPGCLWRAGAAVGVAGGLRGDQRVDRSAVHALQHVPD
jgi:CAAX prenyl protease N-terminal, five membrane helices